MKMKVVAIKSIADVSSGNTPSRRKSEYWNGSIPWITTGELESGYVTASKECVTEKALKETALKLYHKGTVLIAMYGQGKTRGTAAVLGIEATVNQACAALTVHSGCSKFLFYQLQNSYHAIRRLSNTGNQENLNAEIIKNFKILWPDELEQQKIAAILSTQDKVTELKEKLLVQKQQQKKYLMQQLLTGKKRLPGFGGEWKTIHLNEISCRIETKNTVGNSNVLTISAQYGLINQTEFFDKVIASNDKSNYYLLSKDEFAYNRSYSKGYPYGTIKRLKRYVQGVVSPLYICFAVNKKLASLDFLEQYFEASIINREIQSIVQEGARNHGMLNVAVDDFFRVKITMPEIEEQKEIAEILSTADHEIDLLQKSIETEKQKKKALMQLLLTGKVRVKI